MRGKIEVIAGEAKGKSYIFDKNGSFLVGRYRTKDEPELDGERHSPVDLRITEDKYVSRNHFLIEIILPDFYIRDLGSTNHTYVNGERIDAKCLSDDDIIEIGDNNKFRFTVDEKVIKSIAVIPCVKCNRLIPAKKIEKCFIGGKYICENCQRGIKVVDEFPEYEILSTLGKGGMGITYKARRRSDNMLVTIKAMKPSQAIEERAFLRFKREAHIMMTLEHPFIVKGIEFVTEPKIYFVQEYIEGMNLWKYTEERGGNLNIEEAFRIILPILNALDYCHNISEHDVRALGMNPRTDDNICLVPVVHRDIKPNNILIEDPSGNCIPKLTDFGLAKSYEYALGKSITLPDETWGTFPFMAPEQLINFRESKPTVDIFSLGATLYYIICGEFVYDFRPDEEEIPVTVSQCKTVPIRNRIPTIPKGISHIIDKSVAVNLDERYKTAREMKVDIERELNNL
jgi:serine/threonine-protein kinase